MTGPDVYTVDAASLTPVHTMCTFFPPAIQNAFCLKNVSFPCASYTEAATTDRQLNSSGFHAGPREGTAKLPERNAQTVLTASQNHRNSAPTQQTTTSDAGPSQQLPSLQPPVEAGPSQQLPALQPPIPMQTVQQSCAQQPFPQPHPPYLAEGQYMKPSEGVLRQQVSQPMLSMPQFGAGSPSMLPKPQTGMPMPYMPMFPTAESSGFPNPYLSPLPILPPPMDITGMHNRGSQSNLGSGVSLNSQPTTKKRPRVSWTPELHRLFEKALEKLGNNAVPKQIMLEMNVEGLTRESVASHLQKFRLTRSHQDGASYVEKEDEEVNNTRSPMQSHKVPRTSAAASRYRSAIDAASLELEGSTAQMNGSEEDSGPSGGV